MVPSRQSMVPLCGAMWYANLPKCPTGKIPKIRTVRTYFTLLLEFNTCHNLDSNKNGWNNDATNNGGNKMANQMLNRTWTDASGHRKSPSLWTEETKNLNGKMLMMNANLSINALRVFSFIQDLHLVPASLPTLPRTIGVMDRWIPVIGLIKSQCLVRLSSTAKSSAFCWIWALR